MKSLRRSACVLLVFSILTTCTESKVASFPSALNPGSVHGSCSNGLAGRSRAMRSFVSRSGSKLILGHRRFRFAGANIYWLGLDENVGGIAYPSPFRMSDALQTAVDMGVNVVRSHTLGISTGIPLSIEPSLGRFNYRAFKSIDSALYEACRLGIRLIIPLTDNWHYFEGSYHDFTRWLGLPSEEFFASKRAIDAFEQYISVLLRHRNPLTGLELRNDPTVMAWELGNELNGMTPSWIAKIAGFIHRLAPKTLIAAGQQYGVSNAALADPFVDIVDVHYYPPSTQQVHLDASQVALSGKVFIAGEYGSIFANQALFNMMASDSQISGAAFWSLFAHLDTSGFEQHQDGETLHFPGISPAMRERDHLIRAFDYKIRGVHWIPDPAPGVPKITSLFYDLPDHLVKVFWRGSTDAASYSVQRSANGRVGSWRKVCDRCATDDSVPFNDGQPPSGRDFYRVIAYSEQGLAGGTSPTASIFVGRPASGQRL